MLSSTECHVPKKWIQLAGTSRVSGPGHTRWHEWKEENWIPVGISFDSYTSGTESVIGMVVGMYFDIATDEAIGLLVQKRMKASWTVHQLVLLPQIQILVDFKSHREVHGEASSIALLILESLVTQLINSKITTDAGQKIEDRFVKEVCEHLVRGLQPNLVCDVSSLLSELQSQSPAVYKRLHGALLDASNSIM